MVTDHSEEYIARIEEVEEQLRRARRDLEQEREAHSLTLRALDRCRDRRAEMVEEWARERSRYLSICAATQDVQVFLRKLVPVVDRKVPGGMCSIGHIAEYHVSAVRRAFENKG